MIYRAFSWSGSSSVMAWESSRAITAPAKSTSVFLYIRFCFSWIPFKTHASIICTNSVQVNEIFISKYPCERALKKAILHIKNAFFYKTEHGAKVGDLFMSLIHTCNLAKVNPFDYLTALQKHSSEMAKHPGRWMPWNYQKAMPKS